MTFLSGFACCGRVTEMESHAAWPVSGVSLSTVWSGSVHVKGRVRAPLLFTAKGCSVCGWPTFTYPFHCCVKSILKNEFLFLIEICRLHIQS